MTIAPLSATRHASTAPATPQSPPQQAPSAPVEPSSSSFPNLDTITLDDMDLSTAGDLAKIPEKVGYLHELGLNYGWGPTSMLEWAIEHIHIYADIPWWGAVALTAVGLRLILLPLYIKSSDMVARQSALMSVTKPISDKMTAAQREGNTPAVQAAWAEMMATRRRAGLSFWDQMAPMFLQAIFGYCGFKLIRAMAALPVPALKTDGFLWLQDMTLADPYLILPVAMAGTIHLLVRLGGESGAMGVNQMSSGMRNVMLYGMPGIILLTMGFQSGLLCVWFASGGALGVIQGQILKNPTVRKRLNMAPLYQPTKEEMDRGLMGVFMGKDDPAATNSARAGAVSGSARRNNQSFMNSTYQSPNLRRSSNASASGAGRVIDVNPVNKSAPTTQDPDMIQPNQPPKKSRWYDQISDKVADVQKKFQKGPLTPQEIERQRKEEFRRRAKAYEQRHQQEQRRRGP